MLVSLTSIPWKVTGQIILENVSKYMKVRKVTGSSQNGFRERVGTVQPGAEKGQGNLINVCKYLMGGVKKKERDSCPVTGLH